MTLHSREPGRAGPSLLVGVAAGIAGGLVGLLGGRALDRRESTGPWMTPPLIRTPAGQVPASGETIVQMVQRVGPAVISIDTLSRARSGSGFPFSQPGAIQQGQGSGFIIDGAKRHAITNNHVVEGAERIRVTLPDRRSFEAKGVGRDPLGDIALIRLEGSGDLPRRRWGTAIPCIPGRSSLLSATRWAWRTPSPRACSARWAASFPATAFRTSRWKTSCRRTRRSTPVTAAGRCWTLTAR